MTELPAALRPWAAALAALTAELAVGLGPMVRRLDELVGRHDRGTGGHGALDGYDGLDRRGDPGRLLVSEWLLAQEVPEEFLRRAATRELLHLAPAYQRTVVRGRVAVLVDTGADVLGAGRLAQLAALIVLHRRAVAAGSELVLGILGDAPGGWRGGDLAALLPAWLRARRPTEPAADDVDRWAAELDRGDQMWLLCGRRLGVRTPGRPRTLVSREHGWGEAGATSVAVTLGGERVELALPPAPLAVRALRGAGFRPPPASDAHRQSGAGALSVSRFLGPGSRLILRGSDPTEIGLVRVWEETNRPPDVVRRHRMSGPVLAAGSLGRRVVLLSLERHAVRVGVIGKSHWWDRRSVPLEEFGAAAADVEALAGGSLAPVYVSAEDGLLCPIGGAWWRLGASGPPVAEPIAAVGYGSGRNADLRVVRGPLAGWSATDADRSPAPGTRVFLGLEQRGGGPARPVAAWSEDGSTWRLHEARNPPSAGDPTREPVTVDEGHQVLGLVDVGGAALLTRMPDGSGGDLAVRCFDPRDGRRHFPLPDLPATTTPAVHPREPWVASQDAAELIRVVRLRYDRGRRDITARSLLVLHWDGDAWHSRSSA